MMHIIKRETKKVKRRLQNWVTTVSFPMSLAKVMLTMVSSAMAEQDQAWSQKAFH